MNDQESTTLRIEYRELTPPEINTLAEKIASDNTLQNLILWNCGIDDDRAKILAEALSKNTSITTIMLPYNKITAEGIKYFAEKIKDNKTWKILSFWKNNIGDAGAKYLAENLMGNRTLEKLILQETGITVTGAQHFINTLQLHFSVTDIDLDENEITDKQKVTLEKLYKRNYTLGVAVVLLQAEHQNIPLLISLPFELLSKIFTLARDENFETLDLIGFFNKVTACVPRAENKTILKVISNTL